MKKQLCAAMTGLFLLLMSFPVQAKVECANDYILDKKSGQEAVIPSTHQCTQYIDFIKGYYPKGQDGDEGVLNNPQDIFVDYKDNIYIADSGNNAVVKLDSAGNFVMAITEESGKISYPLGVYVDDREEIFVSDNGNSRVVHFDRDGQYIEEFVAPKSELLSQNLSTFDPTKIAINSYNGYVYLLIGKEFLTLDAHNQFKGLVGTEPVGFDLADFLVRLLATDLQKDKVKKREPVSYNNFCITRDNKIYAVSMAEKNQIKKINASGESQFPAGEYGRKSKDSDTGEWVSPVLTDIAVNSQEIITVADQRTSLLYQYNVDGELLTVFGGKGSVSGRFQNITSLCYNTKDQLLVLDGGSNSVQVLNTTAFMQSVHEGIALYRQGRYDEALNTWAAISEMVSCYPVAQTGMANIYYKQERYPEALEEYREAGNKTGYGRAFEAIRTDYIVDNFGWLVPLGLVLIAAVVWLVLYARRYCMLIEDDMYHRDISCARELCGMSQLALFHPIQTWDALKWRRFRHNWLPAVILPLLTVGVRYLSSACTAYTVSRIESYQVSFWYELLLVAVPYLTFGFALYKISGVLSGEMTLCETFSAQGYSLIPMIVLWPPLTALSYGVAEGEMNLFAAVKVGVYIWVALNILSAVKQINDVPLLKAMGLVLLSVLGTLIVWALCALMYILTAQLGFFGKDFWAEIVSRLYSL